MDNIFLAHMYSCKELIDMQLVFSNMHIRAMRASARYVHNANKLMKSYQINATYFSCALRCS